MIARTGRRPSRWLGLALLGLLLAKASGAGELELYHPRHRPAGELAPLAQGLLGSEGTVVADPHSGKLILNGSASAVQRALQGLRQLDTPLAQYRIEAWQTSEQDLRLRGFEVGGWLEVGELRIGRVRRPGTGASVVFRTLRTEGAELQLANLLVLEGHEAEIWTGALHPVALRVFRKRSTDEQILETTPLVPIRSGFRVRPTSLADGSIQLEIAALVEEEGPAGTRARTAAYTRVQLQPGEEIAIAEIGRQGSKLDTSSSLRYERETSAGNTLVGVRVSPTDSDRRP